MVPEIVPSPIVNVPVSTFLNLTMDEPTPFVKVTAVADPKLISVAELLRAVATVPSGPLLAPLNVKFLPNGKS